MNRLYVLLVTLLVLCSCVTVAGDPPASTAVAKPRYTFSWPLDDSEALKPRGGTTRGVEVTLDLAESADWRALQSPNLSAFERDRRAILAMAGTYRMSFIQSFYRGNGIAFSRLTGRAGGLLNSLIRVVNTRFSTQGKRVIFIVETTR